MTNSWTEDHADHNTLSVYERDRVAMALSGKAGIILSFYPTWEQWDEVVAFVETLRPKPPTHREQVIAFPVGTKFTQNEDVPGSFYIKATEDHVIWFNPADHDTLYIPLHDFSEYDTSVQEVIE